MFVREWERESKKKYKCTSAARLYIFLEEFIFSYLMRFSRFWVKNLFELRVHITYILEQNMHVPCKYKHDFFFWEAFAIKNVWTKGIVSYGVTLRGKQTFSFFPFELHFV